MSLHAWVTAGLAVGLLGLTAAVAARSVPEVGPAAPTDSELAARVARLEGDLDETGRLLRGLRRDATRAPAVEAAPAGAPGAEALPPDPGADASALEARVAAVEEGLATLASRLSVELADPASLSTDDLIATATAMSSANRNGQRGEAGYAAEEAFWREALSRSLTDEQRLNGLYRLGIALRGQKRHDEEARAFEEMLQRAGGIETEQGASASFQLAWARVYGEDPAAAVEAFDGVVRSGASSSVLRVHALLRAGQYSAEAGDVERARGYLDRLLTQHRDEIPPSQPWILTTAEDALRKLDAN